MRLSELSSRFPLSLSIAAESRCAIRGSREEEDALELSPGQVQGMSLRMHRCLVKQGGRGGVVEAGVGAPCTQQGASSLPAVNSTQFVQNKGGDEQPRPVLRRSDSAVKPALPAETLQMAKKEPTGGCLYTAAKFSLSQNQTKPQNSQVDTLLFHKRFLVNTK